ncbi:hypothetical protein X797_002975 [Metarhizium robertsii]|uniref:Uncharacterized protein n=1 Tax=Metarhizium robertsii TaxID=568076 RepID=A0A0A1V4V8_9HYPO|nr:hypothetical protein X797_002975 [Metarhizium robertsii]
MDAGFRGRWHAPRHCHNKPTRMRILLLQSGRLSPAMPGFGLVQRGTKRGWVRRRVLEHSARSLRSGFRGYNISDTNQGFTVSGLATSNDSAAQGQPRLWFESFELRTIKAESPEPATLPNPR